MFSKKITVTVGGLTQEITRRHGLFMGEITTHTGAVCTSELFRLPSESENAEGASLYLAPSEAFLSKSEHEGEVTIDWSYQKFTPRIWRKGFRCASPAMILSAISQNPEALAGGKVLFPLERGFRLFRGNSVMSCVLVWDAGTECGEGIIASISPTKSDLMGCVHFLSLVEMRLVCIELIPSRCLGTIH
jgi:hypothetical protein